MRQQDILLRRAAKAGDEAAAIEIASRYLSDAREAKNYALAMAYLLDHIRRGSVAAKRLAAELVPVDVLARSSCLSLLEDCAGASRPDVRRKLGLWLALRKHSRARSAVLLDVALNELEIPACLAARLIEAANRCLVQDPLQMLAYAAEACLDTGDLDDTAYCLAVALHISGESHTIKELVVNMLVQFSTSAQSIPYLHPKAIHQCLLQRTKVGDANAWMALGCGWAGQTYGLIPASAISPRTNHRKAVGSLLRAADAGKREAWLKLHALTSNYRSSAANQDMAMYCLEKAAAASDHEALCKLATINLRAARTVYDAEEAVAMLCRAATDGSSLATLLLRTFLLERGNIPAEAFYAFVQKVEEVDVELATRLRIARSFCLTADEAFSPLKGAFRPWGLVIGAGCSGRVIPALNGGMQSALAHCENMFAATSGVQDLLGRRKLGILADLLQAHDVAHSGIFSVAGSHKLRKYSFGQPWADRLKEKLPEESRRLFGKI